MNHKPEDDHSEETNKDFLAFTNIARITNKCTHDCISWEKCPGDVQGRNRCESEWKAQK